MKTERFDEERRRSRSTTTFRFHFLLRLWFYDFLTEIWLFMIYVKEMKFHQGTEFEGLSWEKYWSFSLSSFFFFLIFLEKEIKTDGSKKENKEEIFLGLLGLRVKTSYVLTCHKIVCWAHHCHIAPQQISNFTYNNINFFFK